MFILGTSLIALALFSLEYLFHTYHVQVSCHSFLGMLITLKMQICHKLLIYFVHKIHHKN